LQPTAKTASIFDSFFHSRQQQRFPGPAFEYTPIAAIFAISPGNDPLPFGFQIPFRQQNDIYRCIVQYIRQAVFLLHALLEWFSNKPFRNIINNDLSGGVFRG
jgi:hypothetical protein